MKCKVFSEKIKPVSEIILGTDVFGSPIKTDNDAFVLMDKYREMGGNCFDTARMYSVWLAPEMYGRSEICIGKYIKSRGCRDEIVISTKCGHPPTEDMSVNRLTYSEIVKDVDESLLALGTDYIDILWLHRDNALADLGEVMHTLSSLEKAGKILSFGASNWKPERIESANELSKSCGGELFVASQTKYSLARTSDGYNDDPTLVEYSSKNEKGFKKLGLPMFAFASQGKGIFSKLHDSNLSDADKAKIRYFSEDNLERARRLFLLSSELEATPAQVSLAYLTSNPDFEVFPIIGSKTTAQLCDSIAVKDITITPEMRDYLDLKRLEL